jgi:hypothetical protein
MGGYQLFAVRGPSSVVSQSQTAKSKIDNGCAVHRNEWLWVISYQFPVITQSQIANRKLQMPIAFYISRSTFHVFLIRKSLMLVLFDNFQFAIFNFQLLLVPPAASR